MKTRFFLDWSEPPVSVVVTGTAEALQKIRGSFHICTGDAPEDVDHKFRNFGYDVQKLQESVSLDTASSNEELSRALWERQVAGGRSDGELHLKILLNWLGRGKDREICASRGETGMVAIGIRYQTDIEQDDITTNIAKIIADLVRLQVESDSKNSVLLERAGEGFRVPNAFLDPVELRLHPSDDGTGELTKLVNSCLSEDYLFKGDSSDQSAAPVNILAQRYRHSIEKKTIILREIIKENRKHSEAKSHAN